MMSSVAVVILNFNGKAFLDRFLPALQAHCGEHEIVVADNGSSDDSIQFLKSSFPGIRLIEFDVNHGFPGGYNQALSQIDADYYVILNSDVEVTPNWLDPMISFMDENQEYAAVQPKILDFHNKHKFEYAGAAGGFLDSLGYPYCRGRIFNTLEEDKGQYDSTMDVFWATGACMFVRSRDFHAAGGFDASFFAHMEEIDLCWRFHKLNRKIACIPDSVVYHVGGGTLAASHPRKTYLNFRNGQILLLKNLPIYRLWVLPVRLVLDLLAGIKFWKESGFRHLLMILKAHIDFFVKAPLLFMKRGKNSSTHGIIKVKSIVWQYFVRGVKTYDKLGQ